MSKICLFLYTFNKSHDKFHQKTRYCFIFFKTGNKYIACNTVFVLRFFHSVFNVIEVVAIQLVHRKSCGFDCNINPVRLLFSALPIPLLSFLETYVR